jgi:hypothetical protein
MVRPSRKQLHELCAALRTTCSDKAYGTNWLVTVDKAAQTRISEYLITNGCKTLQRYHIARQKY